MLKWLSGAATIAMMSVPAQAAVSFSTNSATFTSLGDELGTDFDTVSLGGLGGVFTGAGTYNIFNVSFTAGPNRNSDATFNDNFLASGQAGGNTLNFTLPYTLKISSTDTLSLGGNSLVYGGYKILFNPLTLNSGGGQTSGMLTATVTAVPEAGTWAMMIAGVTIVGFAMRRRGTNRRKISFV